jgi:hypothetical protein
MATTRPMVLTTRRSPEESVQVKEDFGDIFGDFQTLRKDQVMDWVTSKMTGGIKSDKIYIEVSGPDYMYRRFVDLPGFQLNNNDTGTYESILDLLKSELENPNTVVVCVEDVDKEYVESIMITAIKLVFGEDFKSKPNLAKRFVVVLNKTDAWLQKGTVTADDIFTRMSGYSKDLGLVPILVGGSVDPDNTALRLKRNEGSAAFEDIVQEYGGADQREQQVYENFLFQDVSLG